MSGMGQYFVANAVSVATGFLSVVIFVRVFLPAEYGQLSLVTGAIGFAVIVGTAGLPQSAVRFHWSMEARRVEREFAGSLLIGGAAISALVSVAFALGPQAALGMEDGGIAGLLPAAAVGVFWTCVGDLLVGVPRARHETRRYNFGLSLRRVLALAGSLVLSVGVGLGLRGFLWGLALGEAVACLVLVAAMRSRVVWRFERAMFVESLAYGGPHLFVVGAGLVLSIVDRYVIQLLLGAEAVGVYVLGVSVAATLSGLITRPFNLFLFPAYTKTWETQGASETSALLSRASELFLMVYIPLTLGAFALQNQIVALIAPGDYGTGAQVVGIVFLALMFHGLSSVSAAGLYLTAKTWRVGVAALGAAILNVLLNLLLVPRWGVWGAAVVTLISYAAYYGALTALSYGILPIPFPVRSLCRYLIAGAIMVAATIWVVRLDLVPLLLGPLTGLIAYAGVLALVDRKARAWALQVTGRSVELRP
ncbi:MAG: hypothetical protein A3I00_05430 [Betaproteobacteria bacterium RIFCSPLOWO2_02_FULL_64_12]|nr:MAG: hypothetical protein A3I00_05430 [Betaproteobacteria bacterium RIFCSPLOWO2_02_FULL_64_12]